MDYSPIVNQIAGMLWYLIPIAIFAAVLKSPWFKGMIGEFMVNVSAKLMLNKDQYHLIKNVTLPTDDGTTQIDHVIVSVYGVFVVETKNLRGWIFGKPNQRTWTQKIYKHTNKFQNPLHQNHKHVETLKQLLGLKDKQVHSLVVFVGDSTFKTEMPDNVTYGSGYVKYIKSWKEQVLTQNDITEIVSAIESGRLRPSFKTHREHVKHVTKLVEEKKSNTSCPTCGSPMVLRETKKGRNKGKQFWGCSRFPQCRGIVAIP